MKLKDFESLRVRPGERVKLARIKPDSTRYVPERDQADPSTQKAAEQLGEMQDLLYAQATHSLLVVLQGMDASGKDGTVRKVFDAVNPAGCQVTSFKQPSSEELRHDFLWRVHAKTPPRGFIGVFNRSHYEDVLVVRVHSEKLLAPEDRSARHLWERRFREIRHFEEMLAENRTRIVKFFLHISKEEQRQRFIARQKNSDKNWKLAAGDFEERAYWDDYQAAYEDMLPATSTELAPWYIIPADHKWARNYLVAHILAATMKSMKLEMPVLQDKSLLFRRFK